MAFWEKQQIHDSDYHLYFIRLTTLYFRNNIWYGISLNIVKMFWFQWNHMCFCVIGLILQTSRIDEHFTYLWTPKQTFEAINTFHLRSYYVSLCTFF